MNATKPASSPPLAHRAEKAITLALRLAHAENALRTLTSGQVDAVVDPDGNAYLLRPAQEHLRQNEKRLQAVIESIADVITVVNRSGVIVAQNRAVQRVLGYAPEELVGSRFFEFVHEADLLQLHSAFFNVSEGFQENATAQFRHRLRDGAHRPVEVTLGILPDAPSACVIFSLRPLPRLVRTGGAPRVSEPPPSGDGLELELFFHRQHTPFVEALPGIAARGGKTSKGGPKSELEPGTVPPVERDTLAASIANADAPRLPRFPQPAGETGSTPPPSSAQSHHS